MLLFKEYHLIVEEMIQIFLIEKSESINSGELCNVTTVLEGEFPWSSVWFNTIQVSLPCGDCRTGRWSNVADVNQYSALENS